MAEELELIPNTESSLGEGTIWHAQKQVLYWVDIVGEKVHIYDPATGSDRTLPTGQPVGTVVPRRSGGLMVAVQHGFASLDTETGKLEIVADPEGRLSKNRFNDGKCDPAGRFWAGTMPFKKGADPKGGSLYCLFPDHHVERKVEGVACSNGIVWSLDHRMMYYIDTPTREVWAYDYDIETGAISNKRVAISVPEGAGHPDGMTIDAEGLLWVAHWGGSQVICWDPKTGKQVRSIPVPATQVSSCAFGGPRLDELYISTARVGLSKAALKKQPHAGRLFRIRPGACGVEAPEFAG